MAKVNKLAGYKSTGFRSRKNPQDAGINSPTPDISSNDSKMDRYLEMMNQVHQTTNEHIKNTQTILGKMVEVNNNLTSIITNNILVNNVTDTPPVVFTSTSDDLDRSPQQQRFKQSYPRLR